MSIYRIVPNMGPAPGWMIVRAVDDSSDGEPICDYVTKKDAEAALAELTKGQGQDS